MREKKDGSRRGMLGRITKAPSGCKCPSADDAPRLVRVYVSSQITLEARMKAEMEKRRWPEGLGGRETGLQSLEQGLERSSSAI